MNRPNFNLDEYMTKANENVDNLHAEIKELEAELAALREANRWIPVSERLPENGQEILALGRNKTVDSWLYYPAVEGVFRLEYTHWRPLPEPPEQP